MANAMSDISNRYDFHELVLKDDGVVAVCFYRPANRHSKSLLNTFASLEKEFAGRVRFYGVDVTMADLLDADWKIRNVPVAIIFNKGKLLHRCTNEQNQEVYRKVFNSVLERQAA